MALTAVSHHHGRVASLSRDREPDDPELVEARQNLAAAVLTAHIRKVLTEGLTLTDDQRKRIHEVLRSGGAR
ncbi:hypothetical protein CJ179_50220 [Rhodococcus sp. ACS1]|uniref:hypothetical protein n=1 Tax=Rhodococcus sp. ACS1 TaxID=2028570 RepID=UPI000BB115E5|nr:hypothetical protein [Rhodococcus sp. ACS1]PBC35037.1 hypothetical protein CJ179_50220 [Rhodococcus sp. ACS1]